MGKRRSKSGPLSAVAISAPCPEVIKLVRWCHGKNGFSKSSISPAEFRIGESQFTYRGMCALKRVPVGAEVLFMPEAGLITSNAFPNKLLTADQLTLHEKFSVFVILEMSKKLSEYSPYLETLPLDFACHHPGYLKKNEVALLPTWCSEIMTSQQKLIQKGFQKLAKFLEEYTEIDNESITFQRYCWAWYTVNTRTVFYKKKEADGSSTREMALVPYLDLFNHAPEPNTKVTYEEGKGYLITSIREILPKEQIFISYGPHPNFKLWAEYGFIPVQQNPFNCIPFTYSNENTFANLWLQRKIFNDKRKTAIIRESNLLNQLYILENELSPNLELLIAVGMWNPDKEKFGFNVNKSDCRVFLEVAQKIIETERNAIAESLDMFQKVNSNGVTQSTCSFLEDCLALCDKVRYLYNISSV